MTAEVLARAYCAGGGGLGQQQTSPASVHRHLRPLHWHALRSLGQAGRRLLDRRGVSRRSQRPFSGPRPAATDSSGASLSTPFPLGHWLLAPDRSGTPTCCCPRSGRTHRAGTRGRCVTANRVVGDLTKPGLRVDPTATGSGLRPGTLQQLWHGGLGHTPQLSLLRDHSWGRLTASSSELGRSFAASLNALGLRGSSQRLVECL